MLLVLLVFKGQMLIVLAGLTQLVQVSSAQILSLGELSNSTLLDTDPTLI